MMPESEADKKLAEALKDKAKQDVVNLKGSAEEDIQSVVAQFKEQTAKVQKDLEKDLKSKFVTIATIVISGVVLVLVGAMYTATKDVYGSVIALQKEVSSVQPVIRDATKELDTTRSSLVQARGEVEALKAQLVQAMAEAATLRSALKETNAAYEDRLKSLGGKVR